MRFGCGPSPVDGPGGKRAWEDSRTREATIKSWAEAGVKSLHGSPSVDEAKARCGRVLEEVEAEVRQATLNEVEENAAQQGSGSRKRGYFKRG